MQTFFQTLMSLITLIFSNIFLRKLLEWIRLNQSNLCQKNDTCGYRQITYYHAEWFALANRIEVWLEEGRLPIRTFFQTLIALILFFSIDILSWFCHDFCTKNSRQNRCAFCICNPGLTPRATNIEPRWGSFRKGFVIGASFGMCVKRITYLCR